MDGEERLSSSQETLPFAKAADPALRPRQAGILLRRLAAVLVFGYVLWFLYQNRLNLSSLANLSIPILAFLFVLSILNSFIYALRFRQVVHKKTGLSIPYGSWFRFFLFSRLVSMMAGQTGNLYRIWIFKKEYGVPVARFLAAALFITWFDTCLYLLLGTAVVAAQAPQLLLFGYPAWVLSLVAWAALSVVPLLAHQILSMFRFSNRWLDWTYQRLLEITSAILTALQDPLFLLSLAAGAVFSFLLFGASIFFCFRGLGLHIDVSGTALFVAVLGLCNRIVITPGGNLGIKELAYGFLAGQLGVGMTQGILVSLLTRLITLITTLVLGLIAGGRHLLKRSPAPSVD